MSFRRQGALLVYDPEHLVLDHILNPESILVAEQSSNGDGLLPTVCGQALIKRSIEDISVGKRAGSLKRKRRLIEMTCVNGAVIFDDNHLLAAGRWSARIRAWGTSLAPGPRSHGVC